MGKSYSIDIRERVVVRVEAGHSRREAAVRYDVSASFAVKLLSRRRAVLRQPGRAVRPGAASWLPIWRFWWRKWKPAPMSRCPSLPTFWKPGMACASTLLRCRGCFAVLVFPIKKL